MNIHKHLKNIKPPKIQSPNYKDAILNYLAWYPKKHPGQYKTISFLAIHTHTLILMSIIVRILLDMQIHGYNKYIHLYNEIITLIIDYPHLVCILITILFLVIILPIYLLIYRIPFNTFIRAHRDKPDDPPHPYKQGRIYYKTNHGITYWAKKRRGETCNESTIWYNDHFFWNIFFPYHSLKRLEVTLARSMEELKNIELDQNGYPKQIKVYIERYTIWSSRIHDMGHYNRLDNRQMRILPGPMITHDTDVEYTTQIKDKSIDMFGRDTISCVKGNRGVVEEQLRDHSYIIQPTQGENNV